MTEADRRWIKQLEDEILMALTLSDAERNKLYGTLETWKILIRQYIKLQRDLQSQV